MYIQGILFMLFVFVMRIVVSNTYMYCVVFCFVFLHLVYPILPVSLDCPFQLTLPKQCELLPSLGVCRPLSCHILVFSSETPMESPPLRMLISSRSINKHGRHRQFLFLIGRFFKIFSSETAWQMNRHVVKKHLWKVLYKDCSFSSDPLTNMAATGHSCLLID